MQLIILYTLQPNVKPVFPFHDNELPVFIYLCLIHLLYVYIILYVQNMHDGLLLHNVIYTFTLLDCL